MSSIEPVTSSVEMKNQKARARSYKKYHIDAKYCANKNKNDNERNKKRYREAIKYRQKQNTYGKNWREKKKLQKIKFL